MCYTYYLYVFIIRILIVIIIFFQFYWQLILLYLIDFFVNFFMLLPSMNKFIQVKKAEEVQEAKEQGINEHYRPLTSTKKSQGVSSAFSPLVRGSSTDLRKSSRMSSAFGQQDKNAATLLANQLARLTEKENIINETKELASNPDV